MNDEIRWLSARRPPVPDGSRLAAIGFCLLIASVPLQQLGGDIVRRRIPTLVYLFLGKPTVEHLQSWEDELERESSSAKAARPPVMLAQAALLRRGNEKVAIGREGWLFYRPGLQHVSGPAVSAEVGEGSPLAAILAFRDALRERRAELILVPVPDKASICAERLVPSLGRLPEPPRNPGEVALFERLRAEGVRVVDPAPLLWQARASGEALYLPRDTHWSPAGLMLVARAVAEAVRQVRPGWSGGSLGRRPSEVSRRGDLYDMLDLPDDTLYPPTTATIEQVIDVAGNPVLPEWSAPLVVLGDSFTNIYSDETLGWGTSAGFAEQIACELGRAFDVIALNDGGVNGSRARLAREPERLEAARVVVWQFSVRDLTQRAGDWSVIPLGETAE